MSDANEDDVGGLQKEALARLDRAVAEFNTVEALQAIHDGNVLAGIRERL